MSKKGGGNEEKGLNEGPTGYVVMRMRLTHFCLPPRGRRDSSVHSSTPTPADPLTDAPSQTTYASVIAEDFSTGEITISNTAAATPQETAAAKGADRGDTTPLPSCQARAAFGSFCDPATTDCWYIFPLPAHLRL